MVKENLINVDEFREYWNKNYRYQYANDNFMFALANFPTANAVEVASGYHVGDVCYYGFADGNNSLSLVEIVKILDDEKGTAEVKFLKVFVDDSGIDWFNYLLATNQTINARFEHLKNITPRI